MDPNSEPKTCCGYWIWDGVNYWVRDLPPPGYGQMLARPPLYCCRCGARLLPNGDVEPRGEVEAERDQLQSKWDWAMRTWPSWACPPTWTARCGDHADIEGCPSRETHDACWEAYLATKPWEKAADPPDSD